MGVDIVFELCRKNQHRSIYAMLLAKKITLLSLRTYSLHSQVMSAESSKLQITNVCKPDLSAALLEITHDIFILLAAVDQGEMHVIKFSWNSDSLFLS